MKINRQFTLVLLGSVLFFALVSTGVSYLVLGKMQEQASYSFLTTTSGFAESMMQDQVRVFEAAGVAAAPSAPREDDDAARWDEYMASLEKALPDLGFALVVDGGGELLASTPSVRADASASFGRHFEVRSEQEGSVDRLDGRCRSRSRFEEGSPNTNAISCARPTDRSRARS